MAALAPSFELLFDLLRPDAAESRAFALAPQADWRWIANAVIDAGLPGLLLAGARARAVSMPSATARRLAVTSLAMAQQASSLLELASEVEQRSAARGIELVALKGAALLCGPPYESLELRGMADIDLLVGEAQLHEAEALLAELGYHADPRQGLARRHDHDLRYVGNTAAPRGSGQAMPLYVELHWTPFYEFGGAADAQAALERATVRTRMGRRLRVLETEDCLLVLLLHLAHNRFRGALRTLVDVAFYLHAFADALDWVVLARRARDLGACFAVSSGLALVCSLLGASVPKTATELQPAHGPFQLLARLAGLPEAIVPPQPLGTLTRRLTIDLLLQDGTKRRARYALAKAAALTERLTGRRLPDVLARRADR